MGMRNHLGNGSTASIRRNCLEEAGLFGEGWNSLIKSFSVRILNERHYRIILIPHVLVGYRVRSPWITLLDVTALVTIFLLSIMHCSPQRWRPVPYRVANTLLTPGAWRVRRMAR
jgi:hypothetical protein